FHFLASYRDVDLRPCLYWSGGFSYRIRTRGPPLYPDFFMRHRNLYGLCLCDRFFGDGHFVRLDLFRNVKPFFYEGYPCFNVRGHVCLFVLCSVFFILWSSVPLEFCHICITHIEP